MAAKRARESFVAFVGDVPRMIHAGDLVDAADPVLKGRGALFEDVETYVARSTRTVEAATAAPGEKRTVTPPDESRPGPGKEQPRRGRGRKNGGAS